MIIIIMFIISNLADWSSKQVYDALMWHSNHAVSINFNDTMADSHTAPLTNATTQKTAYLYSDHKRRKALLSHSVMEGISEARYSAGS